MSLQEKFIYEKWKVVVAITKKVVIAGHKDFCNIKNFVVENKLVPSDVSASRFSACIMQAMRELNEHPR